MILGLLRFQAVGYQKVCDVLEIINSQSPKSKIPLSTSQEVHLVKTFIVR